ncbi:MAG: alpha-hydroxy-acid oxidizing protein [Dehalococcoidia bacterium]|nr:alpha-hydroxy-acid oxidizing protein [Dehalococcoidia bacterium]
MAPDLVNLFDYEARARDLLPGPDYDFVAGGAADEISLRRARAAFDGLCLKPRVLRDVSKRTKEITVLGHALKIPVCIAPAGPYSSMRPEGDVAVARAAAAAGTLMVITSGSTLPLEQIAQSAPGPFWFQQFIYRDPMMTLAFAERARDAGCSAICITLDVKTGPGNKERDIRNAYRSPPSANYSWLNLPSAQAITTLINPAATWKDLAWLAARSPLPVVAKGIMTAGDADLCAQHGARAVIVSNHGARQLDTTLAPIEVLPEVAARVGRKLEVFVDGGIRRGTDVLKALALGAKGVFIGRPVCWGLAVNGELGVRAVLQILGEELDIAMVACGVADVSNIDRDVVAAAPQLAHTPEDTNT